MRAGLVGIIFFAGLLALGHYYGAPAFCRGTLAVPTLDPRQLCTDLVLNRSGSMLLYFGSIAGAMFFGILASLLPGGRKTAVEAAVVEKKAETFEEVVAATDAKAVPATADASAPVKTDDAKPEAVKDAGNDTVKTDAKAEAAVTATPPADAPKPEAIPAKATDASSAAEAAVAAAILSATGLAPDEKSANKKSPEKAEAKTAPALEPKNAVEAEKQPENKPDPENILKTAMAETPSEPDPVTLATAEAISANLAANQNGTRMPFEGTNEDLVLRFRELRKYDGVNSVAQAQRLLDESTLGALARGVDPKQHLSDVAHLMLAEDPDLKSAVVRGVVVHIAARLKELGVVQGMPSQTNSAA